VINLLGALWGVPVEPLAFVLAAVDLVFDLSQGLRA
jgi:hypothetical protein